MKVIVPSLFKTASSDETAELCWRIGLTLLERVPTFIPTAAPSEEICVIVLKNFVSSTVLLFTPVMVSVWEFPSLSVPVIVKITEALSDKLEILTIVFR